MIQCIFANAFLLCADESASKPVGSSEILRKEGREKHGQTPHRGQRTVVFQHGHRVPGVPHRSLPPLRNPSSLQPHAAEPVVHVRFAFGRVAFRLHIPSRTGTGRDASAACFSGCQRVIRTGAGGRTRRGNGNFLLIYWWSSVPPGLRVSGRLSVLSSGPAYRAPMSGDCHRPVHRIHQRTFIFSTAAGRTCYRCTAVFTLAFTVTCLGADCLSAPARSFRRRSATGRSPDPSLESFASFLRHRNPAVIAHRPFFHPGFCGIRRILPQLACHFPPVSGSRVSGSGLAGGSLPGVAAGGGAAGQGHRFRRLHLCTGRRAPVVHRFCGRVLLAFHHSVYHLDVLQRGAAFPPSRTVGGHGPRH